MLIIFFGCDYMVDKKKLLNQLKKDILKYEKIINNPMKYNDRNDFIQGLLAIVSASSKVLPFVLVGGVLFYLFPSHHKPFVSDSYEVNIYLVHFHSSLGFDISYVSSDENLSDNFGYSTGWNLTSSGVYERCVTYYDVKDFDMDVFSSISSLSKDELDELFLIDGFDVIDKTNLKDEDFLYGKDMLFYTDVSSNPIDSTIVKEDFWSNIFVSFLYVECVVFFGSLSLMGLEKSVYSVFDDWYDSISSRYRHIDDKDVEKIKRVLEFKRKNLELLRNDSVHRLKK